MPKESKPKIDGSTAEPLSAGTAERFGCQACGLFRTCHNPWMRPFVPVGWTKRLLLVGEAPGEDEDKNSGRPFTGRAGKLLRDLWLAAGYTDLDIALVNAVRCRPRKNATPTMLNVRACRPFLLQVMGQLAPKHVVCLGTTALTAVLNDGTATVTPYRGRLLSAQGVTSSIVATYHPAAVLHGATHLRERILEDLKRLADAPEPWPKDVWPTEKFIGIDTEYSPTGELLTVGLAGATTAQAMEQPDFHVAELVIEGADFLGGHSVAGDISQLVAAGFEVDEGHVRGDKLVDSLLLARMVDENDLSYELENLLFSFTRTEPWKHKTRDISETDATLWPPEHRVERCRLDAWASRRISEHFWPKLRKQARLVEFTHQIASVLERVSLAGAFVDLNRFDTFETGTRLQMERAKDELRKIATHHGLPEFSPSNDSHVRELLYQKLGLPIRKRTPTKKEAVDKLTLKGLENEVADLLVEYSKYEKRHAVNSIGLRRLFRECGEVEATRVAYLPFHINPLGARTGRRASNSPNSQNWAKNVRSLVRSRWPGGRIGDFDYQKLEVVLIAWLAQDEALLYDFTVGRGYFDVAKGLLGVEVEKDTIFYRAIKAVVLGINYNLQAPHLARNLWDGIIDESGALVPVRFSADFDTHFREVVRLRQIYLRRYPALGTYISRQTQTCLAGRPITSLVGRVRHLPLVPMLESPPRGPSGSQQGSGPLTYREGVPHLLNQAINFPVQSLASDVTGSALIDVEAELLSLHGMTYLDHLKALIEAKRKCLTNGLNSGTMYSLNMSLIFNEVHDDLVIDIHPDHLKRDTELVVETMRSVRSLRELAPSFDLKLGVDVKLGSHWGNS